MKISLKLFDTVLLTDDLTDDDLAAGALGVIVAIFDHPPRPMKLSSRIPAGTASLY